MDKHTEQLLKEFNQPLPDNMAEQAFDINSIRQSAKKMFTSFNGSEQPSKNLIEKVSIYAIGHHIDARIYYPPAANLREAALPTVLFFHGGGWALGDLDCYDELMHNLSNLSGAIFISTNYRLSPEHKYPAGLNDTLTVTQWAFSNIEHFGGDKNKIALMGDSAGGNLALVAANRLHSTSQYRLSALYLIYPVLDVHSDHKSYQSRVDFGDGQYLLARDAIDGTTAWYLNPDDKTSDPDISPMFIHQLDHLPATSVLVAGYDPLRDESLYFASKLNKAGRLVRVKNFESTIHAFLSFGILPVAQQAREYLAQAIKSDLF